MNRTFQIRNATGEDANRLAEISAASLDLAWKQDDFVKAVENPQAVVVVATDDTEVFGYVVLYFAADEGEVPSVAVAADHRGMGAAKALMQEAFDEAILHGVKKVFLEVRESNVAARTLYDGLGFLQVSIRKNFYTNPTENACLMLCLIG